MNLNLHRCLEIVGIGFVLCACSEAHSYQEPATSRQNRKIALDESLDFLDVESVHMAGYTGRGITVALFDIGVHADFEGLWGDVLPGFTVVNGVLSPGAEILNSSMHGTYAAYIITAPEGVAPDAKILPISVNNVLDLKQEKVSARKGVRKNFLAWSWVCPLGAVKILPDMLCRKPPMFGACSDCALSCGMVHNAG